MIRPRAFGGGELVGNRLVRLAYIDETGTSPRNPVAAVAGIVVHTDRDWLAVEEHIKELALLHKPDNGIFHASKLIFQRKFDVLEQLVAIPKKFKLAIVFGYVVKQPGWKDPIRAHTIAYIQCAMAIDAFMKQCAAPDEFVIMTAEDEQHARRALKAAHQQLLDGSIKSILPASTHENLPLTRIKDTVHFASKKEAIMLQIADACGLVLRKHVEQAEHNEQFLAAMFGDAAQPATLSNLRSAPSWNAVFAW